MSHFRLLELSVLNEIESLAYYLKLHFKIFQYKRTAYYLRLIKIAREKTAMGPIKFSSKDKKAIDLLSKLMMSDEKQ